MSTKRWSALPVTAGVVHVVPINDLIRHDSSGGQPCVCGPTTEHLIGEGAATGQLVKHHSLDGRELREQPAA